MTGRDLIKALVEECRAPQTKIEDMLRAFADLFAEALEKGEYVSIPGVGQFNLCPKEDKFAIRFHAAPSIRDKLKLVNPKAPEVDPALLCPRCTKRRKKILPYCAACQQRQYRANKKEAKR